MSAYLKYFALERSPFAEGGSSKIVLGTKALREAFTAIGTGLDEGVARICVSGGPGLGKTSLARALPKLLGERARVALVLDPSVPWDSLRAGLARQWGLERSGLGRASLVAAAAERALVLVVDRAERATVDFLDHLDVLLSAHRADGRPAVQSVLLANLQHAEGHEPPALLWWLDRIHTLQLEFAPLSRHAVAAYIEKHLARAGRPGEAIFTREASQAIYERTRGVPGEIGRLCESLLGEAARQDVPVIDADLVEAYCDGEARDDVVPDTPAVAAWSPDSVRPAVAAWSADPDVEHRDAQPSAAQPSKSSATGASRTPTPPGPTAASGSTMDGRVDGATAIPLEADGASEAEAEIRSRGEGHAVPNAEDEALEAYLSRPPTPEELHALRGGGLRGYAMTVIAIAAVLTLAAVVLGLWLGGDEPGPAPEASRGAIGSAQPGDATDASRPGAVAPAPRPVLARLRGPVVVEETAREGRGGRETTQESPAARKDASVTGEEDGSSRLAPAASTAR